MVAAAALLVLAGLGMFVLGVTTGVAAWSWACLGACVAAGALLVLARRRTPAEPAPAAVVRPAADRAEVRPSGGSTPTAGPGTAGAPATAGPSTPGPTEPGPDDAPDDGDGSRAALAQRPRPGPAATAPGAPARAAAVPGPPEEDGEVTELLLVVDLADEVLVVDGHPRYHLAGCSWLTGRHPVPLPLREARADGFTPCAVCAPDAHLAGVERARRAARRR